MERRGKDLRFAFAVRTAPALKGPTKLPLESGTTYCYAATGSLLFGSVWTLAAMSSASSLRCVKTIARLGRTAWISDAGRDKLRAYGIAPPQDDAGKRSIVDSVRTIACPRCNETATTLVSEFGSTPCKASYKCDSCLEPFEYFKCI